MSTDFETLEWNPSRVLFGLSRIGYTPHSALADIVDNSVTNGAKNINILINKEREELSSNRKNNIKEYIIIDDGDGMSKEQILSALSLGSDEYDYSDDSLSKFGLGLKSASFSQGQVLEVISSDGSGFVKFIVDLNKIDKIYFCQSVELTEDDNSLIKKYLTTNRGTIIRISDVHKNNHPSLKNTHDALTYRLGTIYYYFLIDGISISLNDEKIEPYDVLFCDEADLSPNLDENTWDGKTVCWIKKPTSQTLQIGDDEGMQVKATVEVTQLPHPPIHDIDGPGERKKIRDKYKIGSGNYGFYVYRNKRLISWAERFDGIIPQDMDFYAFRGRILLDSTADDAFNIDVKKSHLELSDEAHDALSDLSDEYKRKSKKAWQRANALKKQILGEEPNKISNEIADKIDLPDSLPGLGLPSPEQEMERKKREEELKGNIRQKMRKEAGEIKKCTGDDTEPTEEEVKNYSEGGEDNRDKRIIRVSSIEDNLLWEPYFDDDHGWSVRINKSHRFARRLFEDNSENIDMQVMFELFLLQAAHTEVELRRNPDFDKSEVEDMMNTMREVLSNLLALLVRKNDVNLPPL